MERNKDFSDLENWRAEQPASLDDLFRSQEIRERIGRLIAIAMARAARRTNDQV